MAVVFLSVLHLATLLSTGKQIRAFSPQKLEALIFMETLPIEITTEAENDKWVEVAGSLIQKKSLTAEESAYLDRLVDLIEAFEDVAYPMGYPI